MIDLQGFSNAAIAEIKQLFDTRCYQELFRILREKGVYNSCDMCPDPYTNMVKGLNTYFAKYENKTQILKTDEVVTPYQKQNKTWKSAKRKK